MSTQCFLAAPFQALSLSLSVSLRLRHSFLLLAKLPGPSPLRYQEISLAAHGLRRLENRSTDRLGSAPASKTTLWISVSSLRLQRHTPLRRHLRQFCPPKKGRPPCVDIEIVFCDAFYFLRTFHEIVAPVKKNLH